MAQESVKQQFSFWRWWFKYGIVKFLDRWLLLHIAVGYLFAKLVPLTFQHVASVIVIPLVGILIGLSFAWVGNAMAILESPQLAKMTAMHTRGIKEYLYTYQSAILILITCIILWSLIALNLHHIPLTLNLSPQFRFFGKLALYAFSSLSIRECWQVVLSTQWLLISKYRVDELENQEKVKQGNPQ